MNFYNGHLHFHIITSMYFTKMCIFGGLVSVRLKVGIILPSSYLYSVELLHAVKFIEFLVTRFFCTFFIKIILILMDI